MIHNKSIKSLVFVLCIAFLQSNLFAMSKTLNITDPNSILDKKNEQITHLKIGGIINRKTIAKINKLFPNVEVLDMNKARIVAYTDVNNVRYRANEIPIAAFNRSLNLKSVILPRDVVKIGKGAFWNCANLEKIVLPDSIQIIDQFAFQLCTKLRHITFPQRLVYIGGASFAGCSLLSSQKFTSKIPPQMPEWNPFSDIKPNECLIYVPAKSFSAYKKMLFLRNFQIKTFD
jgi:hypothetical protein